MGNGIIGPRFMTGKSIPIMGAARLGQSDHALLLRRRGAILPMQVGLPSALLKTLPSPPAPEEIPAMVDTGASITALSIGVAERLGLVQTDSVNVHGVIGSQAMPIYDVKLTFPDLPMEFDPFRIVGANLQATEWNALIGRDLLCKMFMAYDGPAGRFTLTTQP